MGIDLVFLVLVGLLTFKAFRDLAWLEGWLLKIDRSWQDAPPPKISGATDDPGVPVSRPWIHEATLILLVVLVFTPIIYSMVVLVPNSDYPSHIEWAKLMKETGIASVPADVLAHSGWQLLVIAFQTITHGSYPLAGVMATMVGILLTALVLFHWIRPALLKQGISLWWGVGIATALNLVAPVFLVAWLDHRFYLGYLGMITYHNPTIILLRPFALLQFFIAFRCFQEENSKWSQVGLAAGISLLSTFIKPVFAICILPAMGLLTILRMIKKQKVNWRLLCLGLILPTVVTLTWQYLLTYAPGKSGGIIFAPFEVMRLSSDRLLIKFLLSLVFPLSVAVIYPRKARLDIRLMLGWLTFLTSLVFTYFIAESGEFFSSGNFAWTAEICLFILFCTSTLFFIEQLRSNRLKGWLLKFIWILHVISGVIYYFVCLINKTYI